MSQEAQPRGHPTLRTLCMVLQHGRSVLDANIPHELVTLNCLMASHMSQEAQPRGHPALSA